MSANITFWNGVSTVTGSNFLVETPSKKHILVDCGMIQGERFAVEENAKAFGYEPASIDILIVTHAHLDHVGRIPKLVKDGFVGTIYSTPQTFELAQLVLTDAVAILTKEAEQHGIDPMYSLDDVKAVFPLWKTIPYHTQTTLTEGVSVFLKDAGHILGSAMIEFTLGDKKILFTGDVGNSPAPLLRDTEAIGDVDYLIMESVYGDRNHISREQRVSQLETIIKESIARGGTLIIPAFSIDRTQVILYELNNMVEQGRIPSVPIFVDSPMAIKATAIYQESSEFFNENVRTQIQSGDNIFDFPRLQFTVSQEESRSIEQYKGAKIILAGSGMSVGGRIISHEASFLPDPKNTILLVGYQTAGSLGRQLADGAGKVTIHGAVIPVKAKIETIFGYSAHKDSDHLVEFVTTATDRLKKIFVVMGEPKAAMHLTQRLNDELNVKAMMPEIGKRYEVEKV
jgi:metallo-beta-lactamase family protein